MRKITMVSMATAALAAIVLPAAASADWQHNGKGQLKEDGTLTSTGTAEFQAPMGRVHCIVHSHGTLSKTSSTGMVQALQVDGNTTDNCTVHNGLVTVGCTDVSSVQSLNFSWIAHTASTQTVTVTTGEIVIKLHGGIFCPKQIILTPGTVTITVAAGETGSVSKGTLSGQLQAHPSIGGTETVQVAGNGSLLENAGTFGL